jgi:hypothetical protein
MKTINLITAFLIIFSTQIKADDFRDHYGQYQESCIKERWNVLKSEDKSVCKKILPVELKEKLVSYPLINVGPMKVRYWQGKFAKVTTTTKTYEHSYINVCSGVKTYSETIDKEFVNSEYFEVPNPNLSPEISESFRLAPMTIEEVNEVVFQALEDLCKQ